MIGMHLGIAVFPGLGLFGVAICVLTTTTFGISAEPRTVGLLTGRAKAIGQGLLETSPAGPYSFRVIDPTWPGPCLLGSGRQPF